MRPVNSEHITRLTEKALLDAQKAVPLDSGFVGCLESVQRVAQQTCKSLAPEVLRLAQETHDDPEVAFQEFHAVERICTLLSKHNIEAQTYVADIPTALRAEFGESSAKDSRTIGILAEYDALPGIGHACGHHIICAAGVGAFLTVAKTLQATGQPGRVVLYGCPAEEGHSGKETMIRNGAFRDLDAAIMVHPFGWDAADMLWLGRRTFTATWTGRAAHASSQPFMGRNALDAASLAYQGLGLLRQQVNGADRIHAIIQGGERASIIPETAQMKGYVRSPFAGTLADLSQRVDDCLHGAALMAGVDVSVMWDDVPASLPLRTNLALAARWSIRQQECGRKPMPPGVVPDVIAASTDFGNVSHLVPGIHPVISAASTDSALHTRDFEQQAASELGMKAVVDAVYGLSLTALDFLCDGELAQQVAKEFSCQGGRVLASEILDL